MLARDVAACAAKRNRYAIETLPRPLSRAWNRSRSRRCRTRRSDLHIRALLGAVWGYGRIGPFDQLVERGGNGIGLGGYRGGKRQGGNALRGRLDDLQPGLVPILNQARR